jgi:hypothetical protein
MIVSFTVLSAALETRLRNTSTSNEQKQNRNLRAVHRVARGEYGLECTQVLPGRRPEWKDRS